MKREFLLLCLIFVFFIARLNDNLINDFGARADRTILNTTFIQKVIDSAYTQGAVQS